MNEAPQTAETSTSTERPPASWRHKHVATVFPSGTAPECDCTLTDFAALRRRLDVELAAGDVGRPIAESHPHLFSPAPVFIDPEHAAQMHRIIEAIENTVRLPAWQQRVLGSAPPIARRDPRTSAVFMGFDFHVTPDGPRLIEINTNAGGAFLNAAARAAQSDCCDGDGRVMRAQPDAAALEQGKIGRAHV